ncbi:MAG TPA: DUF1552 domain-containing protein [Candidatus Acidoferrales bacterium]|jgi:hypothetical protein|nr:DUF1552 domain-containing protein [Candidatus Acidoferrales bacterium]
MSKAITRRTWLRGAGVAMSLPWLESISAGAPAKSAEGLAEPPLRMAFLFMPNGVRPDYWTPPGDGEDYEFTPHLKPLESLKSEFLLLENLWHKNTVGRNGHWPKVPAWLSGGFVERTTGSDLDSGGTSVDQVAAQRLDPQTPLSTFELGIDAPRTGIDTAGGGFPRALGSFLSWADPHTPVPKEIVPQLAFDRLFRNSRTPVVSSVDPQHPSLVASLQRDETSVLDLVMGEAKSLRRKGSTGDQARLDQYFESVRSVEQRLEAAMRPQKRWINQGKFPLDRPAPGLPDTHPEHVKLMLDILLLAFWTDSTRIATCMLGDAQSSQDYSWLAGVKGSFHGLSHHRNIETQRLQYEKIINWHTELVAQFLHKMHSLDEGGKSLLDNSMVLFGASLKDGNSHAVEDLPLILAGRGKGTLRPGRRLRAAPKTPLCNLHLAMLHRMGAMEKSFGDSTGPLEGLS